MSEIKLTCDRCYRNSITVRAKQVHQARKNAQSVGWSTRPNGGFTDDLCRSCSLTDEDLFFVEGVVGEI